MYYVLYLTRSKINWYNNICIGFGKHHFRTYNIMQQTCFRALMLLLCISCKSSTALMLWCERLSVVILLMLLYRLFHKDEHTVDVCLLFKRLFCFHLELYWTVSVMVRQSCERKMLMALVVLFAFVLNYAQVYWEKKTTGKWISTRCGSGVVHT